MSQKFYKFPLKTNALRGNLVFLKTIYHRKHFDDCLLF